MIIVRCIALAAKNIDGPIKSIIKNSGQGFVVLMINADNASQMAIEFHTMIAVHTHKPVFFNTRYAIQSAEICLASITLSGPDRLIVA